MKHAILRTQSCLWFFTLTIVIPLLLPSIAFSWTPIVRSYQSIRSLGMGGVRMTTGLYDDNFFNNPARIVANFDSRLTLLKVSPELNSEVVTLVSSILKSKDLKTTLINQVGKNLHARAQLILPAYYSIAENQSQGFGLGLISHLQSDNLVQRDYAFQTNTYADTGLAVTYGKTFLTQNTLAIGVTGHAIYRAGFNLDYGLVDYLTGKSLNAKDLLGAGVLLDVDLGFTYELFQWNALLLSIGGAVQNALGGKFQALKSLPLGNLPKNNRSAGVGLSLSQKKLGYLTNNSVAFELTDILNNTNGSLFKLIHFGLETNWHLLALRMGCSQGYLSGGLGLSLPLLTLDFATYGEELGLNAGTLEDRRYTMSLEIAL